jgi:excisionase family DNA binding protein
MAREARKEDDHFFQMYGLNARPPATLNAALVQAIESMHRTLYGETKGEITAQELQFLTDAGVDVEEHPDLPDPMMGYATAFAAILATSLTTAEAAERLRGVTPVRVRQMISDGTLYAVRIDGRWRIPVFQFQDDALVPNIGPVNALIDRALDAVSVLRWYTTPDPELEAPDGTILSPLAWLKAGQRPDPVIELARTL